ncbi:MAG: hypothetical protein Q4A55_06115 [Aerococcus sp.]|nr:hypothetical protein [Aerococcus sp.]
MNNNSGCLGTLLKFLGILLALGLAIMLSPIVFIVSLGCIYYYSKKKPDDEKKKWSIIAAVISAIGTVIFGYSMMNQPDITNNPSQSSWSISQPAKEESKQASNKEDIDWEIVDDKSGIKIYKRKPDNIFSRNMEIKGFATLVAEQVTKDHDTMPNGAIFTDILKYTDSYGNDSAIYSITLYFSPDTLKKINFDNWPPSNQSMAKATLEVADSTYIYPPLVVKESDSDKKSEFLDYVNKGLEKAPEVFANYQGENSE